MGLDCEYYGGRGAAGVQPHLYSGPTFALHIEIESTSKAIQLKCTSST